MPKASAMTTTTETAADTRMSGWNITKNETSAKSERNVMSIAGCSCERPNIAKVMPQVLISTRVVSAICSQPGFTTMFERVKIANVISVIGRQIFNASYMVFRNEALAMRAETAAVSEVGGDSSPQTDIRNTKKCAIHGSMPSSRIGRTITTAPMM